MFYFDGFFTKSEFFYTNGLAFEKFGRFYGIPFLKNTSKEHKIGVHC